jgi:hypothetical protein
METTINGKPAEWTQAIKDLWEKLVVPRIGKGETITTANYYSPRPFVDEYNRGSNKEGFVYVVHGTPEAECGGHVCFAERVVKGEPPCPI